MLSSAPVRLALATGSFLAPESPEFLPFSRQVVPGRWRVDWFPRHERLALHFIGEDDRLFAEIFSEDIAAVNSSVRGPDLTTEVITTDGDYFVFSGRRHGMNSILRELGLSA